MDALKRIEKIVGENAFEQKKKKPRLKFNPGLALIGLRITWPRTFTQMTPDGTYVKDLTEPDWSPGSARKHLNGYQAFGSVPKVFFRFAFWDAPFKRDYNIARKFA